MNTINKGFHAEDKPNVEAETMNLQVMLFFKYRCHQQTILCELGEKSYYCLLLFYKKIFYLQ